VCLGLQPREIGETPGGRKIKRRKLNEEVERVHFYSFDWGKKTAAKAKRKSEGIVLLFCV